MINRRKDGKLVLKTLDLQVFFGDLFFKCKTEEEIDWLEQQLQPMIECLAQERIEELN